MATSNILITSDDCIEYTITIIENSYSTSNNTSNVTVTVNFYRTDKGTTVGYGAVYCTIDGTEYVQSVTNTQKIINSGIDLFTQTLTIPHNSDGSKSLTVSAYIIHSEFESSSQSFTTSLTTIAQPSSITSASDVTLGNACSIKWTPASSSYAYKLQFVIGGGSATTGYISPNMTSAYTYTGYTFAIATWAPYITTATTATCTVTLYTYASSSSSSATGSSSTTFKVTVPTSVVPTVSINSIEEVNSNVTLGVFVQNMSAIRVTFTPTMSYGSSLQAYSVSVGMISYSGNTLTSGSSTSIKTDTITSSGAVQISVAVTDARGRTGTASSTITVYEYSSPKISTFKAVRVDSSGSESNNGTKVKITYNYSVSSLNSQNTCSMTIKYKQSTASSYSSSITSSSSLSGNTSITPSTTFSADYSYDFQITITDKFNTVTSVSSIGTGIIPLSIYWNGTGIAIGKNADTSALFDVVLKQCITAAPYQLEILNSETSGATGMWCKSWSGRQIACEIDTEGDSMGLYDQNLDAWMIYSTSSANLFVGDINYSYIYIGNTSTYLYLRGRDVYEITPMAIAAENEIEDISTLAASNFRDPSHEIITHINSHTYELNGKRHLGLAVNELKTAMRDAGIDPDEYDITDEFIDEDGTVHGAIRYDELIPILISEIQSLNTRLDALETN